MTSVLVPTVDLAPGMPSRVVTISATDITEGGKSMAGQMVRFALSDTLDVTSGGDVIATTQAEVVLDADGNGSIRLPVYSDAVKTWCGDPDWAIIVTTTWGSQKAIRVPAGSTSIALSSLPPVRPLRGREKQWAITGVSVSVTTGSPASATGSVSGGILNLAFTLPAGNDFVKGFLANGADWNTVTEPGLYQIVSSYTYLNPAPGYTPGSAGVFLVLGTASGWAAQDYIQHGGSPLRAWRVTRTIGTWNPWETTQTVLRGTLPAGTDVSTVLTPGDYDSGGATNVASLTNWPSQFGTTPGWLNVRRMANGVTQQIAWPMLLAGGMNLRPVMRTSSTGGAFPGTWQDLVTASEAAGPYRRAMLVDAFKRRRGHRIGTGGVPVVCLRFDHGMDKFKAVVLPLLEAREIPWMNAMNSRMHTSSSNVDQNLTMSFSEVQDAAIRSGGEVYNHSATHIGRNTETELRDEIVNGLIELQAALPRLAIEGWAPPGVSNGDYLGYQPGRTAEQHYDTYAGRLIMAHHAAVQGYFAGAYVPQPTNVDVGTTHYTIDQMDAAGVKGIVDRLLEGPSATLRLMLHPNQVGVSGYMSAADLAAVLDDLAARRARGEILLLSNSGALLTDPSTKARLDLLRNGSFLDGLTGWAGTGWTVGGGSPAAVSTTTGGLLTQTLSMTQRVQFLGAPRELVYRAKSSTGAVARARVAGAGWAASRDVTVPSGGGWVQVRKLVTIPLDVTGDITIDIGRVSGGDLTIADAHLWTI